MRRPSPTMAISGISSASQVANASAFGGRCGEDDVAAAMLDSDIGTERRAQRFLEGKRILRRREP